MESQQKQYDAHMKLAGDDRVWASLNAAAWYLGDSIDHLQSEEEKNRARILMQQVFAFRREIEKRRP